MSAAGRSSSRCSRWRGGVRRALLQVQQSDPAYENRGDRKCALSESAFRVAADTAPAVLQAVAVYEASRCSGLSREELRSATAWEN